MIGGEYPGEALFGGMVMGTITGPPPPTGLPVLSYPTSLNLNDYNTTLFLVEYDTTLRIMV